jgi:hypothetical protein
MGDLVLIVVHIVCVTAVCISAYRAGFKACRDESKRQAESYAIPLAQMLEQLNLDIETFLDDRKER